ncbi:MAG TPA: sigma 54-interacting transcriptional regulator [Polyangiaceae bacterium]|nr:sigma 54-interacting transcriptional regulator [Polyangiaceae bacterium]
MLGGGQAPKTVPPAGSSGPAVQSTRSVPRLEWTDDSGPRTAAVERRCVLGSAPHCDVIVADQAVSRVHAEIEPRDEGVWIRDLNSRNGTFVEGVRVESASVLHGYTIRVGATEMLVSYAHAEHDPVESWPSERFGPLVGRSQVMRELFATLARLAPTESSIMITGETGTGKELVARAIHQASMRASGPFIVVDCATLSESLIEAELFGHTKGAFTGAHQNRAGAIETAHGGTVFLDEIGELPIGMQPKLLRVLESSTVRRIGESKHRSVNVRFLTATHRDLLSMVNRGEFREDLYFRLAVLPVRVPSLRERLEDIELLLMHFSESARDWLTPAVLRVLEQRPWRGNVRELRNFAERARAIGAAEALDLSSDQPEREPITAVISRPSMPQPRSTIEPASQPPLPAPGESATPSFSQPFRSFREQWIGFGERAFLRDLLQRHQNNVASAAKEAGIDRTHMYRLMRKHGL